MKLSDLHKLRMAARADRAYGFIFLGEPELEAPLAPTGPYLCSVCRCAEVDAGEGFDTCADCARRV